MGDIQKKILGPIEKFFARESSPGILLAASSVIAMGLANSLLSHFYFELLGRRLFGMTLHHWINDGLMVVFFFVVGMEIKRELVKGELSTVRKAALPFAAALGGMIGPGIIYYLFNTSGPAARGWGIPMATDIAFAVGILSLFGRRVPLPLKIFLLALAIVDDLGAVVLIAIFYSKGIVPQALAVAVGCLGLMYVIRRTGVRSYIPYLLIGFVVWLAVLKSGIHATVAGVLIGLLTPERFPKSSAKGESFSPIDDLVHLLHPWVSFLIMPVFALSNAGVSLDGVEFTSIIQNPVHQGIVLGLFFGKPIGIILMSLIVVKIGLAQLPRSVDWPDIYGVGLLGGIGFTMALFISGLALGPEFETYSKTGILLGSLVSAGVGSATLYFVLNRPRAL